jgi:hypothetical protein
MGFLVVVVLLLVVMPGLLYLLGWGAQRITGKVSTRAGVAVDPKVPGD